jgi:hypothetical protein
MEIEMRVFAVVVLAMIAVMMQAKRQPRWEVTERSGIGASVHWFSLNNGGESAINVRQLYFGTGDQFRTAGYSVPEGWSERLCCMVVAVSQITTVNARGENVWMTCLIGQGVVGDIYSAALKAWESKDMKWIGKRDLMVPPNDEVDLGDDGGFDSLESTGELTLTIRHDEHPQNPARSVYMLSEFKVS